MVPPRNKPFAAVRLVFPLHYQSYPVLFRAQRGYEVCLAVTSLVKRGEKRKSSVMWLVLSCLWGLSYHLNLSFMLEVPTYSESGLRSAYSTTATKCYKELQIENKLDSLSVRPLLKRYLPIEKCQYHDPSDLMSKYVVSALAQWDEIGFISIQSRKKGRVTRSYVYDISRIRMHHGDKVADGVLLKQAADSFGSLGVTSGTWGLMRGSTTVAAVLASG